MRSEKLPGFLLVRRKRSLLFALFLVWFQLGTLSSSAQFTKLVDLGSVAGGANPYSPLATDGTFLYGMTTSGGANDVGTVYKMMPDGTGYSKLLDFNGANGSDPYGALFFDGVFFYGMTTGGGANGNGILFKIKPDGSGYTSLLDFDASTSGSSPFGAVISDGTFLYGTTSVGGTGGSGTVFKIKPDGTGYATLLSFDYSTNGATSYSTLVTDGTYLYGMTQNDASGSFGAIFKVKTDGTGYANVFTFSGTATGSGPVGSLVYDGMYLYGMTPYGGANNIGVVFKVKPDGSGFVKLLDFVYSTSGAYPRGSLVYDGTSYLYGMTTQSTLHNGTIFKIKTDGTGFVKLQDVDTTTNGPDPEGTLLLLGTTLCGTASGTDTDFTGLGYLGTVFKINTDGTAYNRIYYFEATGNTPSGSLALIGTSFYGMTAAGGQGNFGTIFKVNSDGTGFTTLLDFNGTNGQSPAGGRLISDGTFFYGMTASGGANSDGIVFKIKPDGTGFVDLLDFNSGTNGNEPNGSLIYDGVYLYGMTSHGGANAFGTIFKIKPDGTGYVKLLDFNDPTSGSYPNGSLFSVASVLYGMTSSGGANGWGTLFKINLDGTGFATLMNFDNANTGSSPNASLFYDGTFFYGMTAGGGLHTSGTLFKIKPDGTGYVKLLDFDGANGGGFPFGSVNSDGTFLYGMTSLGGALGEGTLFKIKPDGSGYIKLFDFNDGSFPQGSLISDGSFLYGMTKNGGANGLGTIFKSTLTPYLTISTFAPASGVVGTGVTIFGTDFDPMPANNAVKFNGVLTPIISGSTTTLKVLVPAGATSGPISVTASTSSATPGDFEVETVATMSNDTIQNCNVPFSYTTSGDDNLTQTFLPVNPTDKVKVSFSTFNVGDELLVYDGPSTASPLLATLNGNTIPADIVATGSTGALTFLYSWEDSGSDWDATITCQSGTTSTVSITTQQLATAIGGTISLNLVPLITTSNNSLDLTSLQIVSQPTSGATASIDGAGVLTINYSGLNFSGADQVTIKACDTDGTCATQVFAITVEGDIIVYNGVSPNGANPSFVIKNIDLLPDTKDNKVYIFDRWENLVWHGADYDNSSVVFTGVSDGGSDLPSGVYFYKVEFTSGRKRLTGFISLRRK